MQVYPICRCADITYFRIQASVRIGFARTPASVYVGYSLSHDNLVIFPHPGGGTFEFQRMAMSCTVRKLVDSPKGL